MNTYTAQNTGDNCWLVTETNNGEVVKQHIVFCKTSANTEQDAINNLTDVNNITDEAD